MVLPTNPTIVLWLNKLLILLRRSLGVTALGVAIVSGRVLVAGPILARMARASLVSTRRKVPAGRVGAILVILGTRARRRIGAGVFRALATDIKVGVLAFRPVNILKATRFGTDTRTPPPGPIASALKCPLDSDLLHTLAGTLLFLASRNVLMILPIALLPKHGKHRRILPRILLIRTRTRTGASITCLRSRVTQAVLPVRPKDTTALVSG